MEVFIVLGTGGTPDHPRELFVIALSEAEQVMTKETLQKYKSHNAGFRYDIEARRLY